MSNWIKVGIDDIEIDGDDINILYSSDYNGNNYVYVKLDDILKLIKDKLEEK